MIAVGSTSPLMLAGLIALVVCIAGVVAGLEWIAQTYLEDHEPEAPCPSCATSGIIVFHSPTVCRRDWRTSSGPESSEVPPRGLHNPPNGGLGTTP